MRKQSDIVSKCVLQETQMQVYYVHRIRERWVFDPSVKTNKASLHLYRVDCDNLFSHSEFPSVAPAVTLNKLDPLYEDFADQFNISSKYLHQFCFANVQIFLHRFAQKLAKEGIKPTVCTESMKDEIRRRAKSYPVSRDDNTYIEHIQHQYMWRSLVCNDEQVVQKYKQYWTPSHLALALNWLYQKREQSLTLGFIIGYFGRRGFGLFLGMYPVALAALIKDKFGNVTIINKSERHWVDFAASLIGAGPRVITISDNKRHKCDVLLGKSNKGSVYYLSRDYGSNITPLPVTLL